MKQQFPFYKCYIVNNFSFYLYMDTNFIITLLGTTILSVYFTIKVFDFYGVDKSYYLIYIAFYIFLLITLFIL
jgi:hypothetical protein